jgi:Cdc6-like AAA superfamily ATPase
MFFIIISSGSERIFVVGDSGVGKTSFVNFVRTKAREGKFFSPCNEIEINKVMSGQEFLISTLINIYQEVKEKSLLLSEDMIKDLGQIHSLTRIVGKETNELSIINFERLKELFKKVVKEIVHPRYKGMILHYDNLDNIEDIENIPKMFGEIRDILLIDDVTFIFVGNSFLPEDIGYNQRVRQIFHYPPIEISELDLKDIKEILEKRIKYLASNSESPPDIPHTEEALKILFDLYKGNIRHILKSLSACVYDLADTNNPIEITNSLLINILVDKVKKDYIDGLTEVEKSILVKMLEFGKPITPTEISKITKKKLTNISALYLPKLRRKTAIEIIGKEGRNIYYEVRPEIRWLLLEKMKEKEPKTETKTQIKNFIEKKLTEFTNNK